MLKGVFRGVHRLREHRGQRAGEQAGEHAAEQALRPDERGMRRHREERSEAEDVAAHRRGRDAGERDRE